MTQRNITWSSVVHLLQEMNQIEAYTVTKRDAKELLESYKKRFLVNRLSTAFTSIFFIQKLFYTHIHHHFFLFAVSGLSSASTQHPQWCKAYC